jgi:hypothetical protein
MGRRGVDVEGANNGSSIEEVRKHLVDLGVLLPVVAFGILFRVPEAERTMTRFDSVSDASTVSSTNPDYGETS